MMRGVRHGRGVFTFKNGDKYDGQYVNGHREGKGTFIWHKGGGDSVARYEGEFKNNEMHGRGTLTYPDGSVHLNAEWANGQRVGSEGEFRFRAGHTYTGNWAHSTFNDAGCFTYAEGDKYEGQWHNGERSG